MNKEDFTSIWQLLYERYTNSLMIYGNYFPSIFGVQTRCSKLTKKKAYESQKNINECFKDQMSIYVTTQVGCCDLVNEWLTMNSVFLSQICHITKDLYTILKYFSL